MSSLLKIRKRAMLPIDQLEALRGEPDSGIFKIRHRMNPALHPRYLGNLTLGLVNHFNELINHYHPDLEGILAGFGKIFLRRPNGQFLNEEAHIHLDVASDFWVFRPSVGAQLRGVVNKKSASHVSVLVHGCFNVPCHLPPGIQSSEWCGTKSRIGQIVRFTVTKTDMSQKIPYIQGNLLSNSVEEKKMANQNILFDNRVSDLSPEEFDKAHQTSEFEDSGIEKTKKKRKRDVAFSNDVETPPKKKKKKANVEGEVSDVTFDSSSSKKKKKKKVKTETGESATNNDEDLTKRMLEAIKDMEGMRQDGEEASMVKKKKKKNKGKDENSSQLLKSVFPQKDMVQADKIPETSNGVMQVGSTNLKKDETSNKPRKVPPYAIYMKENRKKLKSEHPDMSFTEIAKKMGEKWRSLSQEEKNDYVVKAKLANEDKIQKWNLTNARVPESKLSKEKGEQVSAKALDAAFRCFVNEKRADLKKLYQSLSMEDTDQMIDDMWKNCPKEQKDEYKKRAEDANQVEVQNTLTKATQQKNEGTKKKPGKTSSYMMFFQEIRPIIIKKFPDLKFVEISKRAGDLWKGLTEVEKNKYKRKADVLYEEKLKRWALDNSSNQESSAVKKAATPKKQKGRDKTGTPIGGLTSLDSQSQTLPTSATASWASTQLFNNTMSPITNPASPTKAKLKKKGEQDEDRVRASLLAEMRAMLE